MTRYDRNAWTAEAIAAHNQAVRESRKTDKQIREALADPPFARPALPRKPQERRKGKGQGSRSNLEETLALLLKEEGILYRRQVRFCPNRKWTADFEIFSSIIDAMYPRLFVEVEGAVHRIKGRFKSDIPKYNQMTIMGYRLIRVAREHINSGEAIKWIREAMKYKWTP